MSGRVAILVAALGLFAGCRAREVGHFGEGAFYHVRDHYRVRYGTEGDPARALLPAEWRIDNYQVDGNGRPTLARRARRFRIDYTIEHASGHRVRVRGVELFDLRYTNRRDGAVIFARTLPLSTSAADRELEGLMRDYVDRASGGSYVAVSLLGRPAVLEQRWAPRVLREGPAVVSGQPGYYATVEMVDVDRHRVDPSSRGETITLVMMRPGHHRWRAGESALPMLVLFGLATRPEHHDEHLEQLRSFISRVDVRP